MTPILLSLGASLGWGVADYFAGLQSRRSPVVAIVLVSQAAGLIGLAVLVMALGRTPPDGRELVAGLIAGVCGLVAVGAFYRALAVGTISVVAPIVATSGAVPVLYAAVNGERPAWVQWVGIAAAIAGCVLATREGAGGTAIDFRLSIVLALICFVVLGGQLCALSVAAEHDGLWAVLIARTVSVGGFVVIAGFTRPAIDRATVPRFVLIGLVDTAANACFALATTGGPLAAVAVIASTFSIVTVALAHVHLGERLARPQRVGVLLALVGVVAIATRV